MLKPSDFRERAMMNSNFPRSVIDVIVSFLRPYGRVHVCVRFRPNTDDSTEKAFDINSDHMRISCSAKEAVGWKREAIRFQFDRVFDSNSTQDDIQSIVVEPLVKEFLQGNDAAIFTYGQTGSGKSHTMIGFHSISADGKVTLEFDGILKFAIDSLLSHLESSAQEFSLQMKFSALRNEKIHNLLRSAGMANRYRGEWFSVETVESGMKLLLKAETNRSRIHKSEIRQFRGKIDEDAVKLGEHSIMTLRLKVGDRPEPRFKFYDLAASENVVAIGSNAKKVNANRAIREFKKAIAIASERKQSPLCGETELARHARFAFGRRSRGTRTVFIINAFQELGKVKETVESLRFGEKCMEIIYRWG